MAKRQNKTDKRQVICGICGWETNDPLVTQNIFICKDCRKSKDFLIKQMQEIDKIQKESLENDN
jgi:hypothetical protein